jgi:hypothetical protein
LSQELRTVGQGLTSLDVADFDLRRERDGYFALAIPRAHAPAEASTSVRNTWWNLARGRSSDRLLAEAGPGVLRVLFTPEGILRLEAAGVAMRNTRPEGTPDLTGIAQALRVIGERLDERTAQLLKVSKRGRWIICDYAQEADERMTEEWKMSELVNLWRDVSQRQGGVTSDLAPASKTKFRLFGW